MSVSSRFVIELIRVDRSSLGTTPLDHSHRPSPGPPPLAAPRGRTASPFTHPGRPAHARPPTERPCWTRSVAMRPWPSPSQSQPCDDSTGPICGARVRGGSRPMPSPRRSCVTLEPQQRRVLGLHSTHAPQARQHAREHASSNWLPCTTSCTAPSVRRALEPTITSPAVPAFAQRL